MDVKVSNIQHILQKLSVKLYLLIFSYEKNVKRGNKSFQNFSERIEYNLILFHEDIIENCRKQ